MSSYKTVEQTGTVRTALEDFGEIEALKDEMEEWQQNMEGTGLESTEKYSAVEAAYESLGEQFDTLTQHGEDALEDESAEQFMDDTITWGEHVQKRKGRATARWARASNSVAAVTAAIDHVEEFYEKRQEEWLKLPVVLKAKVAADTENAARRDAHAKAVREFFGGDISEDALALVSVMHKNSGSMGFGREFSENYLAGDLAQYRGQKRPAWDTEEMTLAHAEVARLLEEINEKQPKLVEVASTRRSGTLKLRHWLLPKAEGQVHFHAYLPDEMELQEIPEWLSEMRSAAEEVEAVDFPGMFG
jgi:DNA repair exonuclease SbcCD ATPase subunit